MGNPSGKHTLDFIHTDENIIEVRPYTDKWGAYFWDLTDFMPSGDTLASAVVKTYVDEPGHLKDTMESTSVLVESGTTGVDVATDRVYCKFQWPGTTYIGWHRVELEVTFTSTGKHAYKFGYVRVEA